MRATFKSMRLVLAAALGSAPLAAHADIITVTQNHRAFSPDSIDVKVGDTVHIVNDDVFIHNVYVISPNFNFDSEEQEPEHTQDIRFTTAGDYEVHCHVHLRMVLKVHVHEAAQ